MNWVHLTQETEGEEMGMTCDTIFRRGGHPRDEEPLIPPHLKL